MQEFGIQALSSSLWLEQEYNVNTMNM